MYFNSLQLVRPQAGGGESYSVATVHVVRAPGDESAPEIAALETPAGQGLQFSLTHSVAGATYAIYASDTLVPTQNWRMVTGTAQTGTGGSLELTLTNDLPAVSYYRIGFIFP